MLLSSSRPRLIHPRSPFMQGRYRLNHRTSVVSCGCRRESVSHFSLQKSSCRRCVARARLRCFRVRVCLSAKTQSPAYLPCRKRVGKSAPATDRKLAITQIVGIKAQHGLAGMLVMSAVLLFYTCALVPVQICMWDYDNNCVKFPTLYFDVFVDVFFLVRTTLWT